MSCDALPEAFIDARLYGAIDADLRWRGADLRCDGMRRPDGAGLRVTFSGQHQGERLTLVFGVPHLAEGAQGHAVPVNVTLIREGGAVYGTRGDDKCVLDDVAQSPLQPPPASTPPATGATPPTAVRRWRIQARGFCLEPARAIGDGRDAILLATFDFRGQITWENDPPATAPLAAPAGQTTP